MNKPQGNTPAPDRCPAELAPLLSLLLDGQLNAAQRDKLQALLRERADCRRYYLRFMNAHAGMHWTLGMARPQQQLADSSEDSGLELFIRFDDLSARALAELAKMEDAAEAEMVRWGGQIKAGKPIWQQWQIVIPTAIAALLAIAVILIVALPANTTSTSPSFANNNSVDPGPVGPALTNPVATLTAEHDAVWGSQPDEYLRPGSALAQGQRLTLTQGFAEITTQRGAVAIIEAPATVELIDSPNAIHLHAGKLVGVCETDASKGFVVKTAYADITDIGTEFGVEVTDQQLTTTVFTGEVVLSTPGGTPQALVAKQTATITLTDDAVRMLVEDRVTQGFTRKLPHAIDSAILAVDFNSSRSPTELGFVGQSQASKTHSTPEGLINVIVANQPSSGPWDRRRELESIQSGSPNDLYRDFVYQNTDVASFALTLSGEGIHPNTTYRLTFYAHDIHGGERATTIKPTQGTAGSPLGPLGLGGPPKTLDQYEGTGEFTSDANGILSFSIGSDRGKSCLNGFLITKPNQATQVKPNTE